MIERESMALIKCKECGKDISSKAMSCPNCGYPMRETIKQNEQNVKSPPCPQNTNNINTPNKQCETISKGGIKKKKSIKCKRIFSIGFVSTCLIVILGVFYPVLPLLAGLVVILFCVGIFIPYPAYKNISIRFLKVDLKKKWATGGRVAKYAILGISLIFLSCLFFTAKEARAQKKALEIVQKAKKQKLIKEANIIVFKLTNEAQKAWKDGDFKRAISKLKIAKKTKYANNFRIINELYVKMANDKVNRLMTTAILCINSGDLNKAFKEVNKALSVPYAKELHKAKKLKRNLDIAINQSKIKAILLKMSLNDFNQLKETKKLPQVLVSGYSELDKHVTVIIDKMIKNVLKERIKIAKEKKERVERRRKARIARRIATTKAKEARRIATAKAQSKKEREQKIKNNFSAWDGSHIGLTKYIKNAMHDPDSYEHVETKYWDKGNHLIILTTFRGKNGFGGVVKNSMMAKVDLNGNVLKIMK
jgi:ribosomal protein L37E